MSMTHRSALIISGSVKPSLSCPDRVNLQNSDGLLAPWEFVTLFGSLERRLSVVAGRSSSHEIDSSTMSVSKLRPTKSTGSRFGWIILLPLVLKLVLTLTSTAGRILYLGSLIMVSLGSESS